jgi:hypothetical protein
MQVRVMVNDAHGQGPMPMMIPTLQGNPGPLAAMLGQPGAAAAPTGMICQYAMQ